MNEDVIKLVYYQTWEDYTILCWLYSLVNSVVKVKKAQFGLSDLVGRFSQNEQPFSCVLDARQPFQKSSKLESIPTSQIYLHPEMITQVDPAASIWGEFEYQFSSTLWV